MYLFVGEKRNCITVFAMPGVNQSTAWKLFQDNPVLIDRR